MSFNRKQAVDESDLVTSTDQLDANLSGLVTSSAQIDAHIVDANVLATSLYELTETMRELVARLAVLASWANAGAAGMRVVGVSMPSTAVTGPATSAQVVAALLTQTLTLMSTNRTVSNNLLVTQANINNCTGA